MPRIASEVAIHLEKARESALLAVESYNRPQATFRSGGYIVLMCIAWTALLHAIFFKRGIKPFYRRKSNPRHFERVDGDKKAWEISHCAAEFWGQDSPTVRVNLEFFIRLRNKIEHRSMPGLDMDIFGECQALLFNFEDLLVAEFGDRFAINESLSLALQFSCSRNEQQERSVRRLHSRIAKDLRSYIDSFRSSLSAEQLQDMAFSYKVFLLPKPANRERGADLAVEFVKYDRDNPAEMERITRAVALIKPTAAAATTLALPPTGGGTPVRIVTDPTAPAMRAFDYDETHPYRQGGLLLRLRQLLPGDAQVSTYDLTAVKFAHHINERPEYFHRPKFGSPQYSDCYAHWLADRHREDPGFFPKARQAYRDEHG